MEKPSGLHQILNPHKTKEKTFYVEMFIPTLTHLFEPLITALGGILNTFIKTMYIIIIIIIMYLYSTGLMEQQWTPVQAEIYH